MWLVLSGLAVVVNIFLALATGAGGLQGAAGAGFIAGGVLGFPALVGGVLALFPANRNMKSFWKAFFWTSVLVAFSNLSKIGKVVQENGEMIL